MEKRYQERGGKELGNAVEWKGYARKEIKRDGEGNGGEDKREEGMIKG